MKKSTLLIFGLMLCTIVTGCSSGNSSGDPPISTRSIQGVIDARNGVTIDVSKLNGSAIYTLCTALPDTKPEANDPYNGNAYTMTITSATNPRTPAENALERAIVSADATFYDKKKAEFDSFLRDQENKLLRMHAKQLSRGSSDANMSPANITEGTQWNDVFIYSGLANRTPIQTTCKKISAHAYFFIDNNDKLDNLNSYAEAFDKIYEINHQKFGIENILNNNEKIIVVFSSKMYNGYAGYFSSGDKLRKSDYQYSNEGNIIYLNSAAPNEICGTMAHEFQHMIYFDQHVNYKGDLYSWLNEALSLAAEYYNGYSRDPNAFIDYFLKRNYEDFSLTHWEQDTMDYGYSALFIRYIMDQYGDAAIKKMCTIDKAGIAAVEAATGKDFNDIFKDFACAVAISGSNSNPRYCFKNLDLQKVQPDGRKGLLPRLLCNVGVSKTRNIDPYSIHFYNWNGSFGTVNIKGNSIFGKVFGFNN